MTYQTALACLLMMAITDPHRIGAVFADTRAMLGLVLVRGVFGTGVDIIIYY